MPPLERTDMNHWFVLWEYVRGDRNSEPIVLSPIELPCRWEDGHAELVDRFSSNIDEGIDIMLATIKEIRLNSIVWRGRLQNLEQYPNNVPPFDIGEILISDVADDIKARDTRYEYGVRRFKNVPRFTIYEPPS